MHALTLNSFLFICTLILQQRSHANPPQQEAVRVQSGRVRQVVLRRALAAPPHGEPPPTAG